MNNTSLSTTAFRVALQGQIMASQNTFASKQKYNVSEISGIVTLTPSQTGSIFYIVDFTNSTLITLPNATSDAIGTNYKIIIGYTTGLLETSLSIAPSDNALFYGSERGSRHGIMNGASEGFGVMYNSLSIGDYIEIILLAENYWHINVYVA